MTTSGKVFGNNLVFKLDTQGGSLTDISDWVKSVDGLPAEIETGDITCGGAAGHQWLRGLPKTTIKIECVFDDASNSAWDVVKDFKTDTATRSFEFGPAGLTAGFVKITGELVIKSCPFPAKTVEGLAFTINAELDGADTIGVWT